MPETDRGSEHLEDTNTQAYLPAEWTRLTCSRSAFAQDKARIDREVGAKDILPPVYVRAGNEQDEPGIQNGVKIVDGKVVSVTYPNGKSRQFKYDGEGQLNEVTQPDGTVWQRKPGGDHWTSNTGKSFDGKLSISAGGEYTIVDGDGVTHTHKASGLKVVDDGPVKEIFSKPQDFAQAVKSKFSLFDADGNGFISNLELNAASQNKTFDSQTRAVARALNSGYGLFVSLGESDSSKSALGVSNTNMDYFQEAIAYESDNVFTSPDFTGTLTRSGIASAGITAGTYLVREQAMTKSGWGLIAGTILGYGYLVNESQSEAALRAARVKIEAHIAGLK